MGQQKYISQFGHAMIQIFLECERLLCCREEVIKLSSNQIRSEDQNNRLVQISQLFVGPVFDLRKDIVEVRCHISFTYAIVLSSKNPWPPPSLRPHVTYGRPLKTYYWKNVLKSQKSMLLRFV